MMLTLTLKRGKLRKVDLFDVKMADGINEDSVILAASAVIVATATAS